ncbi:MAG: hypothetical protein K2Y37_11155 [Pirellulales bacterium]|nr:hypothetical protein [Pirellulales bacterium]
MSHDTWSDDGYSGDHSHAVVSSDHAADDRVDLSPFGGWLVSGRSRRVERGLLQLLPGLSAAGLGAVLALCGVALAASFYPLNHTDIWGHMALGRRMVETSHTLTSEPFRFHEANEPFFNPSWLSQVTLYLWYEATGAEGLVLAQMLLAVAAAGVMMLALRARDVPPAWSIVLGVASHFLALPIVGTMRPQSFAPLLCATLLFGLARVERSRLPLFWLPPLLTLWANLHGSFLMGLFVLGLWTVGQAYEARRATSDSRRSAARAVVRRLVLLCALCTAATFANPDGPALLWQAALFSRGSNLARIVEWQPLVLKSLGGLLFYSSLLVTMVLLRRSPRRFTAAEVLVLLAVGLSTLSAIRMLAWWALVWTWIVGPHLAALVPFNRRDEFVVDPGPNVKRAWLALAAIFVTILWSPPARALVDGRPRPEAVIASPATPIYLADDLVESKSAGRFFSRMDWGDYILWRTHGALQPMVYAHVHNVPPVVWSDYEELAAGSPAWLRIVDHYRLKYLVLCPQRQPVLCQMALESPRCRLVYRDEQGLVFEVLAAAKPPAKATDKQTEKSAAKATD